MRKEKNVNALTILLDVRTGQKRKKIKENAQIPIDRSYKIEDDVQKILHYHCTGSPKLRKLLSILAEVVVLRQKKVLIWVKNQAQSEWLQPVSHPMFQSVKRGVC